MWSQNSVNFADVGGPRIAPSFPGHHNSPPVITYSEVVRNIGETSVGLGLSVAARGSHLTHVLQKALASQLAPEWSRKFKLQFPEICFMVSLDGCATMCALSTHCACGAGLPLAKLAGIYAADAWPGCQGVRREADTSSDDASRRNLEYLTSVTATLHIPHRATEARHDAAMNTVAAGVSRPEKGSLSQGALLHCRRGVR